MTVIHRKYIPQTRDFKPLSGNTGGVVNDSNSTTIIVDFPEGYLDDKDAFIAFNVTNPETNQPYWYDFSSGSIEIPYEVASKVEHNKLDYQLILVGKDNPNYVEQSFIDTAMFARSIQDYPQIAGSPVPAVVELDMLRYRQSQTVIEALDEIKDYIQEHCNGGGSGSESGSGSGIDTAWLESKFSEILSAVSNYPAYGEDLSNINSSISMLSDNVQSVQSTVSNIPYDIQQLGERVESTYMTCGRIDSDMQSLRSDIQSMDHTSTILDTIQNNFTELSSRLTPLDSMGSAGSDISEIRNKLGSGGSDLTSEIGEVKGGLVNLNDKIGTPIVSVSDMLNEIINRLDNIQNNMGGSP